VVATGEFRVTPSNATYNRFPPLSSVNSLMYLGVKTRELPVLLAILLVWAGQPYPAQSQTRIPVVIRLKSYGWEPPDQFDQSRPLIAVDHRGRILVGFKVRQRTGLVTRSQPSLDFHILRFTPDGKLDLSLSLPTNAKGRNGIYLSDTDQIMARANESLQLLQSKDDGSEGGAWRIVAPCALHCEIQESVSRQTLLLSTPAFAPPQRLLLLLFEPQLERCGKSESGMQAVEEKIQNHPQLITGQFAYGSFDGDTYRWPLCDYEHRVEVQVPLHLNGSWMALNDRLFLLFFRREGKEDIEVISADGREKFRPKLEKHEWILNHPAIRSSERGDRIAVDVVTMRGGIPALDIGNHPTARRITVYDVEAGEELASIAAQVNHRYGFQFDLSPDGHRLAILEDGIVRVIDLDSAAKP
jgi:hypothetical protein